MYGLLLPSVVGIKRVFSHCNEEDILLPLLLDLPPTTTLILRREVRKGTPGPGLSRMARVRQITLMVMNR